ncbi:MAG: VOC family protein [Bdellovibrionales bacterium]|nr:VOC family protein [Bdellovibrionales bacterium]
MSKNPVCWFEIYVDNMDRARKFYESVFEYKLEKISSPEYEMWVFGGDNNTYGAHGSLVKMKGFSAGKNSTLVYFSCQDCAVTEKRVQELGGKIEKAKFSIGQHGFISLVLDTESNMIGLHSLK